MKNHNDSQKQHQQKTLFVQGGKAIIMTAITIALVGFMAGLFTMMIISLYKYVFKITSH